MMAPNWMTTRNRARKSSDTCSFTNSSTRIMCPVDEMGSHSVMPSTMPTRSAFKASKIIVLKSPYRKQADRKIVPDTPSPAPRKQKGNMSARRNGPNSIPARTEQAAKKPHAPLRDRTDRRARTLARSPLRACRRTLACSLRPYPPPKGSRAGENASCCC